MRWFLGILAVVLAAIVAVPLIAQEDIEGQKSGFLKFVEDKLSTPDRRIEINGLEGVISSDVKISEITVSDETGVWARILNAELNWSQAALLTGQLRINSLSADKIEYLRAAIPSIEGKALSPEASGLSVPQLPVGVTLESLNIAEAMFGESVFGLSSLVSVTGRLVLAGGSLDTQLRIERLDGPGGSLEVSANYDKSSDEIDLDLNLVEPQDGVLVNLLDVRKRPKLNLRLVGAGPIADLRTDLLLDAGGQRVLTGIAQFDRRQDGLAANVDLFGQLAPIVPVQYHGFFGDQTKLVAAGLLPDRGGFELSSFRLEGGELNVNASASSAIDGFLRFLKLDAELTSTDGNDVVLPGSDSKVSLGKAQVQVDYGSGENWSGLVAVDGLNLTNVGAKNIRLDLTGALQNADDPARRRLTVNGDGAVTGLTSPDAKLADALGKAVGLGFAGLWNAGKAFQLIEARLVGKVIDLAVQGDVSGTDFDGTIVAKADDLAPFSGFAGQQLSGQVDVTAKGKLSPLTSGFDLELKGEFKDVQPGVAALNGLLRGQSVLSGRIARTDKGLIADELRFKNAQSDLFANGRYASDFSDFSFTAKLNDLADVSDQATGALYVEGTAIGDDSALDLNLDAKLPAGKFVGKSVADASIGVAGKLDEGGFLGNLSGNGFLDGFRAKLTGKLQDADNVRRLSGLSFELGGTRLTGDLVQDSAGLFDAAIKAYSPDVSMPAALFLTEATGVAEATIRLLPEQGQQSVQTTARLSNFMVSGVEIGSADVTANITDAFGVPAINGQITGKQVFAGGLDIKELSGVAQSAGERTDFEFDASLVNGATGRVAGGLSPISGGYEVDLETLRVAQGGSVARLIQPSSVQVQSGKLRLNDMIFDVDGGRVQASGTAGDNLNLKATIAKLPLSFANGIVPNLDLAGVLDGTITVSGVAATPNVTFDLSGAGVNAAAVSELGVTPLNVVASGRFRDNIIQLAALQADGPSGLKIQASGALPLVGSNGDVSVKGGLPLSLANRFLADRGGQISGTATIDARLLGSVSNLRYGGTITTSGAQIIDPLSNLRLQEIAAVVRLSSDKAVIEKFNGRLATGGSVNVGGSVSIGTPGTLPADIQIGLQSARYADGNLFVATASGNLNITGDLTRDPLVSGNISLEKAEISIPQFGAGDATLIDVAHVGQSSSVAQTIDRTRVDAANDNSGGRQSVVKLNIAVSAANKIFVRGRGVDAELGGAVQLTGTANNIQPVGGFELIRGRLNILGERINFDRGLVTLVGDLDPFIDFTANSTSNDDTIVIVNVVGQVSDLTISFSSEPELPQDEVLALLIFKRALGDLSPLQLAKLAAAAAELAGGGGNSLVDSLREAVGLDDIDVVTDAEGNAGVKAGAYLQENVYLTVEAGAQGKGKVSIDLDITDELKARGSTTNDGENSIGIFYEKDF